MNVAASVEPVLAPVDKGSSLFEAPEALSFSRGLAFFSIGATTLPHINNDNYACYNPIHTPNIVRDSKERLYFNFQD